VLHDVVTSNSCTRKYFWFLALMPSYSRKTLFDMHIELSRIFNLCHHLFEFSTVMRMLITEYFIKYSNRSLYQTNTWRSHIPHNWILPCYLLYIAQLMNQCCWLFHVILVWFISISIVNISLVSLSTDC